MTIPTLRAQVAAVTARAVLPVVTVLLILMIAANLRMRVNLSKVHFTRTIATDVVKFVSFFSVSCSDEKGIIQKKMWKLFKMFINKSTITVCI